MAAGRRCVNLDPHLERPEALCAAFARHAGAAELATGKARCVPAALVRGCEVPAGDGAAVDVVMPRERDLFP